MWSELRSLWREPGPDRPAHPSGWDRGLALAFGLLAVVEGLARPGPAPHPLRIAIGVALASALWFRRTRPLGAVVAAFGLASGVAVLKRVLGLADLDPYVGVCVLLLPYSLFRWGSGREVAQGLGCMAVAYVAGALGGGMRGPADAIGGAIVMLFPAALGASMRFRDRDHRRELEHAKLREREQLARDLHDTVAHHVTAIAIQAQAGRCVLQTRPQAADGALAAIENEAARALAELRTLVGALRDDQPAALAPPASVADIARLARHGGDAPAVEVELSGPLESLRPSVQAALYRMVQEAVTNAIRHARRATRVRVFVRAEGDCVRLLVQDDGEAASKSRRPGFGLVGMTERAELLGGTLHAGPSADGGWTVEAVLPHHGSAL